MPVIESPVQSHDRPLSVPALRLMSALFTLANPGTSASHLIASIAEEDIPLFREKLDDAFTFMGEIYEQTIKREANLQ